MGGNAPSEQAALTQLLGGSGVDVGGGGTAPTHGGRYTVKRGDTLTAIAAAHGTTVAAVLSANPQIENANLIVVGEIITLP